MKAYGRVPCCCGKVCWNEWEWRRALAILGKEYYRDPKCLPQAFAEIESVSFSAYANAASSEKVFVSLVESSDDVQDLLAAAKDSSAIGNRLVDRCLWLLRDELDADRDYESIHDTAIAVYALILQRISQPRIGEVVDAVWRRDAGRPPLFWSRRVLQETRNAT